MQPFVEVEKLLLIRFIDFTDAITREWGGKPFVDLKKGWEYALKHYPVGMIDPSPLSN